MRPPRIQLAPFVPGLAALGARDVRDLLGTAGDPPLERRAEVVESTRDSVLIRLPLPGTPDASGRRSGPPKGAGTGYVYLRRYQRAALGAALRARLTAPRSSSLAAREWNLLCALRAAGVTVPEPMAIGSEGAGLFDGRSFLVTRELTGFRPALEWLAGEHTHAARRLLLRAVGLMLARLWRSGVRLPGLSARHLHVGDASLDDGPLGATGCGAEADAQAAPVGWRRLPDVAIVGARGGRIVRRPAPATLESLLRRLAARCEVELNGRERLRVFLFATARLRGTAERRRMVTRLAERR